MRIISLQSRLFVAVMILSLVSMPASALRCGNRLVQVGDHQSKVMKLCGTPSWSSERVVIHSVAEGVQSRSAQTYEEGSHHVSDVILSASSRTAYSRSQHADREILIEEWVYEFGRNRIDQKITFEQGYIVEIENL